MSAAGGSDAPAITLPLVERTLAIDVARAPADVRTIAVQCVLDTLGVIIAAREEPVARLIAESVRAEAGPAQATVLCDGQRVSAAQAALANGTTAHALDYDDVNLNINGHPSAVLLPALLALGEAIDASGEALLGACVAGHEFACRAGALVQPDHYARGLHSTSTVGALGAALACARLLGLDAQRSAQAVGIAATRASGLKAMFGTDCKAWHAGLAAEDGVRAALLAQRGMTSRSDVLECRQGFAAALSRDFFPERALDPQRWFIRDNLFKYHAACYGTHSTIECALALRVAHRLQPEQIERILIRVERTNDGTCNIARPRSSHEAKFSLRFTCAAALCGIDTGALDSYGEASLRDPRLQRLIELAEVELVDGWPTMQTELRITAAGHEHSARHDSGVALSDLDRQQQRLAAKFETLVVPVLGAGAARELAAAVAQIEQVPVRTLVSLAARGLAAAPRAGVSR